MKKVKISNLKVGDQIADGTASKYGQQINRIVDEIYISKSGRVMLYYNSDYVYPDGRPIKKQIRSRYSNGPLSPNSLITLK